MALPQWIKKFRKQGTEIRCIHGYYYVYAYSSKYDRKLKRSKKVTGKLLGKITRRTGFTPSEKYQLLTRGFKNLSCCEYGAFELFNLLMRKDIDMLKEIFVSNWEQIIACAMCRWIYRAPIKNMQYHFEQSFYGQQWNIGMRGKQIGFLLKYLGEQRGKIIQYKKQLVVGNDFLLIDSTPVNSQSKHMGINEIGYNSHREYDPQVNLLYIFSAKIQEPLYYRVLSGNIREVKAFKYCLQESGIPNATVVCDKGFYSTTNVTLLRKEKLRFIMPLRRNSKLVDYTPINQGGYASFEKFFMYNKQPIWYYRHKMNGYSICTYLNTTTKAQEETDFIYRISTHPEQYSMKIFLKKQHTMGTLSLLYEGVKDNPQNLYTCYKIRNDIEVMFDAYKTFLHADRTYMQSEKALQGWMFINFLAVRAYYKLYKKLNVANLLSRFSPSDIIHRASSLKKIKINNHWHFNEISSKDISLYNKIGLSHT